jgi:hypothetical protein
MAMSNNLTASLRFKMRRKTSWIVPFVLCFLISSPASAVDDGARSYWKTRSGTHVFSTQFLNLDIQAQDSSAFDPSSFVFPGADAEAQLLVFSYANHLTLFDRPAILSFNLVEGSAEATITNTLMTPPQFLPPGFSPGASLTQSSSGFGDPSAQLDFNLIGTPPLRSTADLLNYEPSFTMDLAFMAAVPLGEYDSNKIVNMGLNRFYGRVALPMTYHFGTFAPGYMKSFEITPSVWLFADNDDFLGKNLKTDPIWQVEAHFTQDLTRTLSYSLDALYRTGGQAEMNGVEAGEDITIGDLGASLTYGVNDNLSLRASLSSNVFGDSDIDTSVVRLQFIYGWHKLSQSQKKLSN